MATERRHTCDLCRETVTAELTSPRCGFGVFFGQRIVRKPLGDAERHVCRRCLRELWAEFSEEMST